MSGRDTVVVAVPDFYPTIGGTVRQAAVQAQGMAERGYRAVVVTRRYERTWPAQEEVDGLAVVRLGVPSRSGWAEKVSLLALALWLARRSPRIAMVQTIMYSDYAVPAWAVGLGRRCAVVWAAHGEATDVLGARPSPLRSLLPRARLVLQRRLRHVALTPAIREELAGLGIPKVMTTVIPVPVDGARFRPPTPDERAEARARVGAGADELVVTFTGRFVVSKGVDRLIDAVGRLKASGHLVRLVLVGGGTQDQEDEVRRIVRDRGLECCTVITGVVSDPESFLWAGDALVLPSVREGLSNSLVEAMACGLACVAAAEAGGDQALYGGAGLVPPSSSVEDITAALLTLADDPSLRQRLGATAVERARLYCVATVTAMYESLIAPEGARTP